MQRHLHQLTAVLALIAVAACAKKEKPQPLMEGTSPPAVATQLSVTDIQLGSAIGADNKVTVPRTEFGAKDTIYASVLTEGAPPAGSTLAAVWTYTKDGNSARVDSTAMSIMPTGSAATAFHVSRPSGFPTGTYTVEIWADGRSAGTRDFTIK